MLGIHTINLYNKLTFQSGLCMGTLRHERHHERIVLPAYHLANVLTNKTNRHRKLHN